MLVISRSWITIESLISNGILLVVEGYGEVSFIVGEHLV